jgi:hypothetical protein
MTRRAALLGCLPALALALAGCRETSPAPAGESGAAAGHASRLSAASEEAARQRDEAVAKSLNPQGLPPYSGPVGGIRGIVTVSGDPAPTVQEVAGKIPDTCPRALEMQRKLFRQGLERSLADVLITVTEYQGFVKPRSDVVRVDAKGCAFDANVIAMVYGQRLDVYSRDSQPYMPRLVGVPSYTLRVAMPGGGPVPVFPPQPGRYLLVEETRDYMRSELYVLNYPTFDVTGLDGAFEITGIPAGEVKVTAFWPALGKVNEQRIKIQSGVSQELKFEFAFSQSEYEAALHSQAAENAGGSAGVPAPR